MERREIGICLDECILRQIVTQFAVAASQVEKEPPHGDWYFFTNWSKALVDVSFPGNVHPERINIICFLLFAAYYPLADAHKHDKQSDCSDSELSGDRPEEDEKSDPCKGVFDAL